MQRMQGRDAALHAASPGPRSSRAGRPPPASPSEKVHTVWPLRTRERALDLYVWPHLVREAGAGPPPASPLNRLMRSADRVSSTVRIFTCGRTWSGKLGGRASFSGIPLAAVHTFWSLLWSLRPLRVAAPGSRSLGAGPPPPASPPPRPEGRAGPPGRETSCC